jgi:hypothetical protein
MPPIGLSHGLGGLRQRGGGHGGEIQVLAGPVDQAVGSFALVAVGGSLGRTTALLAVGRIIPRRASTARPSPSLNGLS